MHIVFETLAFAMRKVVKLMVIALALVLVLSVLAAGMVAVLFMLLRALLTGRKPDAVATFMRFRKASQQFRGGAWARPDTQPSSSSADIVDVEATEVRSAQIESKQ